MSMGRVIDSSQKCHTKHTLPTIYRGSSTARRNAKRSSPPTSFWARRDTQKCHSACAQREGFNIQTHVMSTTCQSFPNNLQGVNLGSQKCRRIYAPAKFLGQRKNAEMSFHTYPRGANKSAQKCHFLIAPAIFIWCQGKIAEVLLPLRTKGKGQSFVAEMLLDVHPSQPVTGGHKISAEMPNKYRPHRIWVKRVSQKCH